jgi:hypothetical protein
MKNHGEAGLSDISSDDLKSQTSNKCRIAAAYVTGAATQERSGSRVVTNPRGDNHYSGGKKKYQSTQTRKNAVDITCFHKNRIVPLTQPFPPQLTTTFEKKNRVRMAGQPALMLLSGTGPPHLLKAGRMEGNIIGY